MDKRGGLECECFCVCVFRIMELPKCYRFMDFHNLFMVLHNWILKSHGWIIKVPNNYRIVEFNKWFMDSNNSIYNIYNSNNDDL